MPASVTKCSVLLVGAGPTGLFLACELHRQGVDCRIIDKNCGPCEHTRATSIQPRSLEILEQTGLVEPFLVVGNRLYGAKTFVDGNRLIDERYMTDLESPFPFEISLPQSRTERLLINHLAGCGITVKRNAELVSFEQDANCVRAILRHDDDEEEVVEAEYLAGCDGAHSMTRRQLGMHLVGADYPPVFAVADVKIDGPISSHEVHLFCSPTQGMFVAPLPERRFLFSCDLPVGQPLPASGSSPSLGELQTLFERAGPSNTKLYDATWSAYFRCHKRLVPKFQVGRVFLAGDAAHTQSPSGGQGMNSGFQDGFNLAWKAALVLHGNARLALIDTYDVERHYIGEQMVALSDEIHNRLFQHHPSLGTRAGKWIVSHLAHYGLLHPRSRTLDETRIGYHHSPIVCDHEPKHGGSGWKSAPQAGDRAPDCQLTSFPDSCPVRLFELIRAPRHYLIVMAGEQSPIRCDAIDKLAADALSRYGGLMEILVIVPGELPVPNRTSWWTDPQGAMHRRYGADRPCLYLIRPDGYVGFRSPTTDMAALHNYLEKIFIKRIRREP